jgi:RNA polymerase sigma factor (sigma-70 family)
VSSHPRNNLAPLVRALEGDEAVLTDGHLLGQFVGRRDISALDALVRRHGPMVWGICRRVLRDHHDAEDAFQTTFLVLVRRAASVRSPDALANWLYGVAHQTARKARATAARRRARATQLVRMMEAAEPASPEPAPGDDLRPQLDAELSRLPGRYRAAIVLCDLEGKTRAEAAAQLGLPEGTVASRLARGRAMLARRLARRGLAITGGSLAVALSGAAGVVPAHVSSAVVGVAAEFVARRTAAGSPGVAALTEGVLRDMFISKLKTAAAILAVVVGIAIAARSLTGATAPAQDRPPLGVSEPKADAPPAVKVEGDDFAKTYQGNDAAGDERFLGKRVRMTGYLQSVKAVAAGPGQPRSYLLILLVNPGKGPPSETQNWQPMHVGFRFGAESRKELAGHKPREWAEVEGTCEGRIGEFITFTDCKFGDVERSKR